MITLPTITMPSFERLFGPPAPALVIRSHTVELLAMQGRRVTSRVRVPLDGQEPAHLAQAIRTALAEAGLGRITRVAVAMPTHDVLFRFFTMPMIPKAEWDAAVQFEARKYIPFKIDELIWDYVVPSKSARQLEVIFAAVQRAAFARVQSALADLGLQATTIEPSSLSLARLVSAARQEAQQGFTCVVDVEADAAHLAIVKGGLPYLTREVNLVARPAEGGQGAGDDISPEEVDPHARRLSSEVSVSMDFFKREYPSSTIGHVSLFGEESRIGPWCRWLSDQLSCPVALGNRFLDRQVDGAVALPLASAVGLLQAAQGSPAVSFDFIKRSQAKLARALTLPHAPNVAEFLAALRSPQTILMGLAAVALLAALWFPGAQEIRAQRRGLQALRSAQSSLEVELHAMSPAALEALRSKASDALSVLTRTIEHRISLAEKLDALARAVPDGVWLTKLLFLRQGLAGGSAPDAYQMTIEGACFLPDKGQELAAIQHFHQQVKGNPKFFQGFTSARLQAIHEQEHALERQRYTYRQFELKCDSARSL